MKTNANKPKRIVLTATVLALFVALLMVGCGKVDLNNNDINLNNNGNLNLPTAEGKQMSATVLIKETVYEIDGSVRMWCEYEYDNAGNMAKMIFFVPGEGEVAWRKFEHEYNADGHLEKTTTIDSDGNLWRWYKYEYDGTGNLIKWTTYEDETIFSWLEYEYNSAGNLIKLRRYSDCGDDEDDVPEYGVDELEYDGAGNPVKQTFYFDGEAHNWNEFEYDSAGNLMSRTFYDDDGIADSQYLYEYDSMGNMIKETYRELDDGFSCIEAEYEYDSTGNLIKKIEYDGYDDIDFIKEYTTINVIPKQYVDFFVNEKFY